MDQILKRLAKPAQRALQNYGISSIEQLCNHSESEIARWHGIGPNALKKIKLTLAEKGLTLGK